GTLVIWRREAMAAFGALGGALVALSLMYLTPFIQHEVQPTRDPGGALESLNVAGLTHNVAVILGLGGIFAFVGMAIGRSLRQFVVLPCLRLCWRLGKSAWQTGVWLAAAVARRPLPFSWKDAWRPLGSLKLWVAPLGAVATLSLAFLTVSNAG